VLTYLSIFTYADVHIRTPTGAEPMARDDDDDEMFIHVLPFKNITKASFIA